MRGKAINPVSVLGAVNSVQKSVTPAPAAACATSPSEQTCAQSVNECALSTIRKQLADLYASCSPTNSNRVREYLDMTEGPDAGLIKAWAHYGRRDRARTVDLRLNEVASKTVSPLGYACLIAYATAWLDEAEAITEQERTLAHRCCHSSGSAAKDRPQATTRLPRVRVAEASKRRSRK